MAALTAVESTLETADLTNELVNKFVVSPIVNLGIAGLAFDIFEEHKVELTADITDHFVEDNSTIQDQIAIKPIKFTLRGFIGEVIVEDAEPKTKVQELTEKLTIINSYIPVVTGAARQLNSLITNRNANTTPENLADSIGTGVDLFQAFKELNPPEGRQAQGYNFFKALWKAKQLVSVDTPFGFVKDMAIENVIATQGDNAYIMEFSITLKEFRTASTQLVDFDVTQYQGRTTNQKAETADKGRVDGQTLNQSIAKAGLNKFVSGFRSLFN